MTVDKLSYDVFPSALGWWGVAAGRERGLVASVLPHATPAAAEERLLAELAAVGPAGSSAELVRDAAALADVRIQVQAYAEDGRRLPSVALDLTGLSAFSRSVAEAAWHVPAGEVVTYGELAFRAGCPGGARAVGQVMHLNRLPLFVPCHRVIAGGGRLGGFGGGLVAKVRLLVHEGALAPGAFRLGGLPVSDPVRRVRRFLDLVGCREPIIQPGESTKTAPEAAAALGVAVGQIAKSLLFVADGRPVLVVTSGDRRVDANLLKAAVGAGRLSLADPSTVAEVTGFPVGGVAPVGHLRPAQVVLDRSMERFPVVFAAAGSPASALPLSFGELARVSGGEVVDVCS